MLPNKVISKDIAPESFKTKGGLYLVLADLAYALAHLANALFSDPESLIFWIPLIIP